MSRISLQMSENLVCQLFGRDSATKKVQNQESSPLGHVPNRYLVRLSNIRSSSSDLLMMKPDITQPRHRIHCDQEMCVQRWEGHSAGRVIACGGAGTWDRRET